MRKKTSIVLAAISLATLSTFAQMPKYMKHVEGGTRILGGGYQYEVKDWAMYYLGRDSQFDQLNSPAIAIGEVPKPNNPQLQVTVASFYIAETEVTNLQYREFMMDKLFSPTEKQQYEKAEKAASKGKSEELLTMREMLVTRAEEAGIMPAVSCWKDDFKFAYNEPLVINYWCHPAFDNYPAVGISWNQAKAYCAWLTETTNAALAEKGKPALAAFRLPTEMEWEYAAHGTLAAEKSSEIYPWGTYEMIGTDGFKANIKTAPGNYHGDGYEYTAPVKSFHANAHGLYHMSGNVGEWVEDVFIVRDETTADLEPRILPDNFEVKRVAKGGSWADYCYAAQIGSRAGFVPEKGTSRVGFRVAMSKN